jgi:uncharacterized protein YoxC
MFESLLEATRNPVATLFIVLAVAFFVVALYLGMTLHLREKKSDQRLKQARADITDMTILFQTMRDIIGQQKKLAREFNHELEHKMGQVKHILSQGMEKNKQLYEKQQRIAVELQEAQAQIDAIFRQIGTTSGSKDPVVRNIRPASPPLEPVRREDVSPPPSAARPATLRTPNGSPTGTGKDILKQVKATNRSAPQSAPKPPARDEQRLADTGVTKASFTSWVAEDLSTSQPNPAGKPTTELPEANSVEQEPAPANGDAAREAFRALLNMPAEESPAQPRVDIAGQMAAMPEVVPVEAPRAESVSTSAMQQRVLEYSNAGMTVADVSKELGIGKGEVRLMLSLAKQNNPPMA